MDITTEIIKSKFPEFKRSEAFITELMKVGTIMDVAEDQVILDVDDYIKVIPLLLNGLIKIYREDELGNEILLYYINSGESCVMSITTCLKNEKSSIKGVVVEKSKILAIPTDLFVKLLNEYNLLHSFTYNLFNAKYNELINSIDNLAFHDTKSRLINYLKREIANSNSNVITGLTHKEIARDLSTSREVVSRLLQSLRKDKLIEIKNKEIIFL